MAARRALLDDDIDLDLIVTAPARAAVEPDAVAFVNEPARSVAVSHRRSRNRRRGIGLVASLAGVGLLMSTITASAAVAEAPLDTVAPAAVAEDQLSRSGTQRMLSGLTSADEAIATELPTMVVADQVSAASQPTDAAAGVDGVSGESTDAQAPEPSAAATQDAAQAPAPEVAEGLAPEPSATREPEVATALVPTSAPSTAAGLSMAACKSGSGMESGLVANAIKAHRAVCANYPSITTYGGLRPGDSGYHGTGQAVDIMVSGATGTSVANFLIANHKALGVTQVIYQQRIWLSSTGAWKGMEDRGSITQNHFDHVHVSVS